MATLSAGPPLALKPLVGLPLYSRENTSSVESPTHCFPPSKLSERRWLVRTLSTTDVNSHWSIISSSNSPAVYCFTILFLFCFAVSLLCHLAILLPCFADLLFWCLIVSPLHRLPFPQTWFWLLPFTIAEQRLSCSALVSYPLRSQSFNTYYPVLST